MTIPQMSVNKAQSCGRDSVGEQSSAIAPPRLMLVFTRGASLGIWDAVGMFDREVRLYTRLEPHLGGISFLTYGDVGESRYQERMGNIGIIANDRRYSSTKFSILAPYLLRAEFKKADIIKTNQLDGAWTAIIAKIMHRKKAVVRCGFVWSDFQRNRLGGGFHARLSLLLERLCLRLADACVVATERDAEIIRERHRLNASKVWVIPNYVDTHLFKPMPDVRREKGLICFVGRLALQKNVEMLLEACSLLEGARLLIIGDGELRSEIARMADQLHLDVEFYRSVPNPQLPRYLNRASVFVLPSHYEGCPKTLLEAMACGLPVVGTDVDGIREIIRNGENGILCEKTAEGLASAIGEMLAKEDAAAEMARKAREYVIERHDLERIVQAELDVILSLCGKGGSRHD